MPYSCKGHLGLLGLTESSCLPFPLQASNCPSVTFSPCGAIPALWGCSSVPSAYLVARRDLHTSKTAQHVTQFMPKLGYAQLEHYTMAHDDGEPQCTEWIAEHRALHQVVDRTTVVLSLMLVLSMGSNQFGNGHRSWTAPAIDVHSGRLGELLCQSWLWVEKRGGCGSVRPEFSQCCYDVEVIFGRWEVAGRESAVVRNKYWMLDTAMFSQRGAGIGVPAGLCEWWRWCWKNNTAFKLRTDEQGK